MGEKAKPEEQAPAKEKKKDSPPPPPPTKEEKKGEEPPQPPPPTLLVFDVELHCLGCAAKIKKSIESIRGVESVATDTDQNQVTVKGAVDPQAICNKITDENKRTAKVLSPLPAKEGEPMPEVVTSQVSGLTTVVLSVNINCEGCAVQLKKTILKMKGVHTVETDLSGGKVTVTGTMDADKLVEYVYKCTKKTATIVPQPEPEKPAEEPPKAKEADKKPSKDRKKLKENNPPTRAGEKTPEERNKHKKLKENNPPQYRLPRVPFLSSPIYINFSLQVFIPSFIVIFAIVGYIYINYFR